MKFILTATAAVLFIVAVACSPVAPVVPAPQASPTESASPTVSATSTSSPSSAPTRTVSGANIITQATPTTASRKTASPTASPTATLAAVSTPGKVPAFSRIYVIVMENKEYNKIIGTNSASYIDGLAAKYGLATNYTAVSHPSQPNYLALFSGSTQGVTDDEKHDINATNLADQLDAKGKTWKVFAQNNPLNCFTGMSAKGGADGSGTYARKHNSAISFVNINSSPKRCGNITDFSHFDPAAADFELILPNMCNVMHDCSVSDGDTFLSTFIPRILNSSAWNSSSVIFLTWDEGNTDVGGGGHIPTIVISDKVHGVKVGSALNHYSLLRTIEDAWGLGCLENACTATNLAEFFK